MILLMQYRISIYSTANNIFVNASDSEGNTIKNFSAGSLHYKGSRKSTNQAAQAVGEAIGRALLRTPDRSASGKDVAVFRARVESRGFGSAKESAIRGLQIAGVKIQQIADKTSLPHGGCKPAKLRRV